MRNRKVNYSLYLFSIVIAVLFFSYLCGIGGNIIVNKKGSDDWEIVQNIQSDQVEDQRLPQGLYNRCSFRLGKISAADYVIAFYTVHERVEVYLDNELVYSMRENKSQHTVKTPGNSWTVVPLDISDGGKEVTLRLTPVYTLSDFFLPEVYYGSVTGILDHVIVRNLPAFIMSILAIVVGLVFMSYNVYQFRTSDKEVNLMMLGQFAVLLGSWKISDNALVLLFSRHYTIFSYIPFLALYLSLIPFILYVRSLFQTWTKLWDVLCASSLASLLVGVTLQVFQIADLRETFWMCHANMLLVAVLIIIMLVVEVRQGRWSRQLRQMMFCFFVCLAGMLADLIGYYLSGGVSVTVWSMAGFLFYIIVLGIFSIKQASRLMEIGRKAERYEQLAYHDQMTGLYNRTAYSEMVLGAVLNQEELYTVVMIDLNNLKHCNDTFGHEKGDVYITSSAGLIERAFHGQGKCFRIGGDEFCVFAVGKTLQECRESMISLQNAAIDWNHEHEEPFYMQIACGCASYDKDKDYDIGDTVRRADKMMYRQKFIMKQAEI